MYRSSLRVKPNDYKLAFYEKSRLCYLKEKASHVLLFANPDEATSKELKIRLKVTEPGSSIH